MRMWLAAVALVATASAQESSRPSFAEFLEGVRQEALARGIRQDIVDEALGHVQQPEPTVIERDRTQAETVLPLEQYLTRLITARLVKTGREAYTKHRVLLDEVSGKYGVPAEIIAGIWGVESNFGRFSGVRPTIAALATLAWDPRRAAFFRGELFAALEILDRGDIEPAKLRGSWAGAMGQLQFMPSSYLKFAEDFDQDGRRDIWASPGDIFASIGNYLQGKGWIAGQEWGREVRVPDEAASHIRATVARRAGTCRATRDMTVARPMQDWQQLGVRLPGGNALPAGAPDAALVSGTTRHFLVHHNYDALLEYNCSHSYAISVARLGQRLIGGDTTPTSTPSKAKAAKRKAPSKAKRRSSSARRK